MVVDVEEVERWIAYRERPVPFPLRGFYRMLGYSVPDYLPGVPAPWEGDKS